MKTSFLCSISIVVTIPRSNKNKDGKRIYDKNQYCPVCCKADQKMARHLTTAHKNDERIKSLLSLNVKIPAEKKERQNQLDELRFLGNFHHNMKVLRTGGELVVFRRPGADDCVDSSSYRPCPYCLAFVTKHEMWRHVKSCPLNKGREEGNCLRKSNLLYYSNHYSDGASEELKGLVLTSMYKDEVTEEVSRDQLITTLGSFLLSSHGVRKGNYIAQRMRLLGRLLIQLKKRFNNQSLSLLDFLTPQYFDEIVETTKVLGGYSMVDAEGDTVATFSKPSLPLKMGYTLDKCVQLAKGIAIKTNNAALTSNAEQFAQLYSLEWSVKISSVATRALATNKFNKVQLLPLTEDLLKIREYLKTEIPKATSLLLQLPSTESWRNLAELTGIRLTMFNRRRISEVFGLLISRFEERDKWKDAEMEEIKKSLTPLEVQLMNRLVLLCFYQKLSSLLSVFENYINNYYHVTNSLCNYIAFW